MLLGIEVDAGEPAEFTIDQEHGSKVSATYLDYVNDDDGICITYICKTNSHSLGDLMCDSK